MREGLEEETLCLWSEREGGREGGREERREGLEGSKVGGGYKQQK